MFCFVFKLVSDYFTRDVCHLKAIAKSGSKAIISEIDLPGRQIIRPVTQCYKVSPCIKETKTKLDFHLKNFKVWQTLLFHAFFHMNFYEWIEFRFEEKN